MNPTRRIYRESVPIGERFDGPHVLTFGWQEARKCFSMWYASEAKFTDTYLVVGTGYDFESEWGSTLVASVTLPDGFQTYHLVRLRQGGPQ